MNLKQFYILGEMMKLISRCQIALTVSLFSCMAISIIAFVFSSNAQEQPEVIKKQADTGRIDGTIQPATHPPTTPFQPADITIRAIAPPANGVVTFNQTVVRKDPFIISVYDSGAEDGDVVGIIVNGKVMLDPITNQSSILLTNARKDIVVNNLHSGVNTIEIAALSEGSAPPTTLGIEYPAEEVLEKTTQSNSVGLNLGESFATTVGFPQIALCKTVFTFPCVGKTYPESAQHVLEAQGIPPEPITAPLVSSISTGNPLRPEYPRLLTIDRNLGNTRRRISIRAYKCPTGQDRDEYPPAVFKENNYSAHIKCISSSDNKGAGSSFGRVQLYRYKETPNSQPIQLRDNDVIEFVILR